MSEYYGVSTPTSDFLAHYGVKGMKWGVRKAIEEGGRAATNRSLSRQFRKAERKLRKLNYYTDRTTQGVRAGGNAAIAGLGAAGAAMLAKRGNLINAIPAAALGVWGAADAIRLGRKATKSGHEKAVKERNEFAKEMKKSFAGTAYAKQAAKAVNAPKTIGDVHKIAKSKKYRRAMLNMSPAQRMRANRRLTRMATPSAISYV